MTPPADLIECANCDGWFTGAFLDEVFYHATCACRGDLAALERRALSPSTFPETPAC